MKVSVGMEDTYLCTVLDLATDSMEMINTPFEKEGEGKRGKKEKNRKKGGVRERQGSHVKSKV